MRKRSQVIIVGGGPVGVGLAVDLGLHVGQVKAVQRRLGLRKCAPNNPGCTSHIDMRGHNKPRKR